MDNFDLFQVLHYGVIGLCAIMLVAAWRIILTEQRRHGEPRKGIVVFTCVFMAFCLLLGALSAYVQMAQQARAAQELQHQAEQKLAELIAAIQPLNSARSAMQSALPDSLPNKRDLLAITEELRKILEEKGKKSGSQ